MGVGIPVGLGHDLIKEVIFSKTMSKKYPECPLYNHSNCKDLDNPEICAIVRKDKVCIKKKTRSKSKK